MKKEELIDNLITVMPIIGKKIFKGIKTAECTKQQMVLLNIMRKHDNKSMSFYSEKLALPRSNLTVIADKLINDGYVERETDAGDRRLIVLKITDKGKNYIDNFIEEGKKELDKKLSRLSEEDIELLNGSISTIINILNKLEESN